MFKKLAILLVLAGPAYAQKADTIKVSQYQRQQFADIKTQMDKLQEQQAIILQTIISGAHDPKAVQDWTINLTEAGLVIQPPKKDTTSTPKPKKP